LKQQGADKGSKDGKKSSSYTFKKPTCPYKVIFDAGPGHAVEVDGKTITQYRQQNPMTGEYSIALELFK